MILLKIKNCLSYQAEHIAFACLACDFGMGVYLVIHASYDIRFSLHMSLMVSLHITHHVDVLQDVYSKKVQNKSHSSTIEEVVVLLIVGSFTGTCVLCSQSWLRVHED